MQQVINYIIILLFPFLVLTCQNTPEVIYSEFGDNSMLKNAAEVSQNTKDLLTGIFEVTEGSEKLGNYCVCKWSKKNFSIFCGKSINFFILEAGIVDSNIVFEGYWRDLESFIHGLSRFIIPKDSGARELINGISPKEIIINGFYFSDNINSSTNIKLKFNRKLKNEDQFYIVAHRGGGRNSDLLPHSENSLEMIELAEALGGNAIEIDIKLTKDSVPILYHDETLNSRLINGDFLIGPVENYYFSHIRQLCKLKHGEIIPTFAEALETIVYKTNLKFVWVDVKTDAGVDLVIPLIEHYSKLAELINRKVDFAVGIPTDEIKNRIINNKYNQRIHTICELTTNDVLTAKSQYWGPRWTLGTQNDKVDMLHKESVKTISWTLDDIKFIQKFLSEGIFDGFVTNYPAIVAYEYYINQ